MVVKSRTVPACWSWPVTEEHRFRVDEINTGDDVYTASQRGLELLKEWQQERCALCGATARVTDHDHRTALVRGRL
jgi:hypothetical protein